MYENGQRSALMGSDSGSEWDWDPHQIRRLASVLRRACGWMKFLAVISIIGALVGVAIAWPSIFWAWLPIWMAVVLFRSANATVAAADSGSGDDLVTALDRLRLYFVINGIATLISLVLSIVAAFNRVY
ncbi:hypothetical protein JW848_11130 [Candidatus Bipolaricaulota bacterium]|nr:hypothetical protein [Candidatus Bipolaricaulota bacterium]